MVTRGFRHEILKERFDPIYHFVALEQSLHKQGKLDLAECDLMIVQSIGAWDDYPLRQFIRHGMQTITFPCLWFASPWPFDGNNGPTDREAEARNKTEPLFTYFDCLLGRLRKEIYDKEQRLAEYRSLKTTGLINYCRVHDFEEHRLLKMDSEFGCEIGRFILGHFRTERLFHTTNHPNATLYTMLMQLICDRMGLGLSFLYDERLDQIDGIQVPIHQRSQKHSASIGPTALLSIYSIITWSPGRTISGVTWTIMVECAIVRPLPSRRVPGLRCARVHG